MTRFENETEDLLLSITKNCETLKKQPQTKLEETLEFKLIKSREAFSFKPSISVEGSWMVRLTALEVYNSIFNIAEENNKFHFFTFPVSEVRGITNEKIEDEIEKDLIVSDITATDLQNHILDLFIFKNKHTCITSGVNLR